MTAVTLAKKTMHAIDSTIAADGGNSFRMWLGRVIPHMDDAYRQDEQPFRKHMGASQIGGACGRALWYGFRWTTKPKFSGRILRLFNRGHLEEARFISMLLMIGVQVYQQDTNGKQFRISDWGGHFGGSGDGLADGVPDLPPGTRCVLEFKTHNDKSFQKLKKEGVRAAKFEHFAQMQTYMHKMSIPAALYGAVNKNDDEIYFEIIMLDSDFAETMIERAGKIIPIHAPPKKLSESPGWFECQWCDHKPVCHLGAQPERNCRTCEYSQPEVADGQWWCTNEKRRMELLFDDTNPEKEDFSLTESRQLRGCENYQKSSAFA